MTSRTEKDRESQRVQEVRRRSQFLAAPSWRALHRKENDWQLAKHTLPAYIPRGSRNSWDPLQGYLEQLPRSKRYCQGLAKTEHRHLQESELSSSSDSDSSGSDSDSESDAPSPVPKPWLKNASKPTWPDPAVIDILIQQACCPLDLSMETTIDDLENSCGSCCARTPRPELRSCTAVDYAEACSSSVQQQADPTQPGSFDTSCSFPLQDMDVDALAGPAVRTGYKGDWLEVSPALLQYWEKASLEPYATPKSVLYYALCPESMQGQARQFFRDLSVVYSMSNLGSHLPAPPSVPGEGPVRIVSSLVPAPVVPAAEALRADPGADLLAHRTRGRAPHSQEDKAFLEGLRAACQGLQQSLASDPPQSMLGYMSSLEEHWDAGASVVVYVLLPCSNWRALAASALFEAASCLAPATGAAGLQCPSGSSRSRLNITLQVVSHTCLGDLSGAAVRALAFTVYDKIRRQPCASDSQASQDNPPPPPTPPVIGFDFSESASPEPPTEVLQACRQPMQASSSLLHEPLFVLPAEQCGDGSHPEARTIHCCYTWGGVSSPGRGMVGRKWVAVCWTDCRGELLEARLLPGPSLVAGEVEENALRDMCNALLQETFRVAARSAAAAGNRMKVQGVVLTRLGCSEAAELVAWETVLGRCLSGEGPSPLLGLERLTLMQLAAASPLQLDSTLEIPSGAFLLQPRSFDGGFKEYRNGRRCMHVVWLPPPSLSLLLLPGEADRVRVLNLEIIQHSNLAYRRQQAATSPSMPSTPTSDVGTNRTSCVSENPEQMKAAAVQVAVELHHLAVLNASFHGLCLARPAAADGSKTGALDQAGYRAHLPLHCSVAHRLWALACCAEHWSNDGSKC